MLRYSAYRKHISILGYAVDVSRRWSCSSPGGSTERKSDLDDKKLEEIISKLYKNVTSVPIVVAGVRLSSGDQQLQRMPHNHTQAVVNYCYANQKQISLSLKDALKAKTKWNKVAPAERVKMWRKCAQLLETKYRYKLLAAIIVGQAKTLLEAERDFRHVLHVLRVNADFLELLSKKKLQNRNGRCTQSILRPLDGFVAAISPFNQTYASVHLALTPALMGNCVMWKPAGNSMLSSYIIWKAILKAGVPNGVINFMPANERLFVGTIVKSPLLAGINFTGRIANFHEIWQHVSHNIKMFNNSPRLSAECGGKNYHFVHESADVQMVADATVKAAFEYSGQYGSSCSRLYVPSCTWEELQSLLKERLCAMKIGDPFDFSADTSAVVNEAAFDHIVKYIDYAERYSTAELVYGGDYCKEFGYFIKPTIVCCTDPFDRLMMDEINGPLLSVFVYKKEEVDKALDLVLQSSKYAYTGSIFATDTKFIERAQLKLRQTANRMYINCKCTGPVEGQIPVAGSRLSDTNDQIGTKSHLMRWSAPQLIEEYHADKNSNVN